MGDEDAPVDLAFARSTAALAIDRSKFDHTGAGQEVYRLARLVDGLVRRCEAAEARAADLSHDLEMIAQVSKAAIVALDRLNLPPAEGA